MNLIPGKLKVCSLQFFAGILLFCSILEYSDAAAQSGHALTDSLLTELALVSDQPEKRLELLSELAYWAQPPELALAYGDSCLAMARELDNAIFEMKALHYRSYAYQLTGKFDNALEDALDALRISDSLKSGDQGNLLGVVAQAYHDLNEPENSYHYYRLANKFLEAQDPIDSLDLASNYYNISDVYLKNDLLDSAWYYLKRAEMISLSQGNLIDPVFINGNTGVYFLKRGNLDDAEPLLLQAASDLETYQALDYSSEYYNHLADLYAKQGNWTRSISYGEKALDLATSVNARKQMAVAHKHLYSAFEATGDYTRAFGHLDAFRLAEDSLVDLTTVQRMARERNEFEIAGKQKELEIQELRANRQRNMLYITVAFVVLLSLLILGLFNRFQYIRRTSRIIEKEKDRSDALLKNILPEETANELKTNGKVVAKQFDSVSVMFADFVGFTRYSENMLPEALVKRVDFYFSEFDQIMEKYGLEKIKTMGDAYMCAGGLPFEGKDHALRMVMAAFDIADFVKQVKDENPDDPTRFEVRLGINTGPVVAGVVGTKKFVYDIWGDTVNIASRMESNSDAGRINVSENTYTLIKRHFECEYRGEVDVKNKGMMKMYFINHPSEEAILKIVKLLDL